MPSFRLFALLVVGAALVGCGSTKPPSETVSPVVRSAQNAAAEAEQAGANTHAPLELRTARQKVEQAEQAMRAGDTDRALRLAEQAEVDAKLAEAKSRAAVAQSAIDEVRATIRVLREEIERNRNR